jgi:hypothetical protein
MRGLRNERTAGKIAVNAGVGPRIYTPFMPTGKLACDPVVHRRFRTVDKTRVGAVRGIHRSSVTGWCTDGFGKYSLQNESDEPSRNEDKLDN